MRLSLETSEDTDAMDYSGSATIKSCVIRGTGTAPAGATTTTIIYGDAFYYATDENFSDVTPYGGGQGLLIEGSQPAGIPPFNGNHEYSLPPEVVTSGPISFLYNSPYGNSEADNWSLQMIVCFLGVP